jgi:UDP-N-acetylmuramate dehydrogenase
MSIVVREHVPLAPYTTLKVGGEAKYLVEAATEAEIAEAVAFAALKQLPLYILGGGSNILVPDTGYRGFVLCIKLTGVTSKVVGEAVYLTVAAGEVFDDIVADTVKEGWWGLENLSAIPGSVGALPVQNVGAYGVEAKDVIESVRVFDCATHEFLTLNNEACSFGYRDSIFKKPLGQRYIVVAVTFRLSLSPKLVLEYKDLESLSGTNPTQLQIRETVMAIRGRKFPDWHTVGTAGSFFKNPTVSTTIAQGLRAQYPELPMYDAGEGYKKISLGYILDKICGLRGYREGNVRLYEQQALVLVAEHGATANEIILFAKHVQEKVFVTTNILIEWEVVQM